jgi:hypothetical protein
MQKLVIMLLAAMTAFGAEQVKISGLTNTVTLPTNTLFIVTVKTGSSTNSYNVALETIIKAGITNSSTLQWYVEDGKLKGYPTNVANAQISDLDADKLTGEIADARIPASVTFDSEWNSLAKLNTAIGATLTTLGDIDSQEDFENYVGWTLPTGGGVDSGWVKVGSTNSSLDGESFTHDATVTNRLSVGSEIIVEGDGTNSYWELHEYAAPGTPDAGKIRGYVKTDGHTYTKDDAGAETRLSNLTESEMEALLDLPELQGTLLQSQLPTRTNVAQIVIVDPENQQTISDDFPLLAVESSWAPSGITIKNIYLKTSASSTYSVTLEEWTTAAGGTVTTIETVATSSSLEATDDGTLSDNSIAAGSIVMVDLPTTAESWILVQIVYSIN